MKKTHISSMKKKHQSVMQTISGISNDDDDDDDNDQGCQSRWLMTSGLLVPAGLLH